MSSLMKALVGGTGLVALVVLSSVSGCSSTASDTAAGGSAGTAGGSGGASGGSSSSAEAGANTGEAGANTGGTGANTGGTSAGTAGSSGSSGEAGEGALGAAGEGGTTDLVAVAKFCNRVGFGTVGNPMDITLRLDVGTAPNIVSFSALTNTCVPLVGADCKPIPLGPAVPVTLIDPGAGNTVLDMVMANVLGGREYVFWTDVGDAGGGQMAPLIFGGTKSASAPACSAFDVSDLP